MNGCRGKHWSRREFLGGLTLAGTAGFLGLAPEPAAAEPPPETTTIRLGRLDSICISPLYLAKEFLSSEGFTRVEDVRVAGSLLTKQVISGDVDIALNFVGPLLLELDGGAPLVVLAGGHVGCFELFGTDRIRSIRDLKGKVVAITEPGGPDHVFLSSMLAYVGVNPGTEVNWVTHSSPESMQLLARGRVDAFLGFPPVTQETRARKIGHLVANSAADHPWSQYFCCMVYVNREFVRARPVATKRALRAILKGADLCGSEPARAARFLVDQKYTTNYAYAVQTMSEVVYGRWREYDPEDTVRFYALRLREAGMIKSSPQKIIAQGTDWRFLNELKKALKG